MNRVILLLAVLSIDHSGDLESGNLDEDLTYSGGHVYMSGKSFCKSIAQRIRAEQVISLISMSENSTSTLRGPPLPPWTFE
jgi:hypothetical protein